MIQSFSPRNALFLNELDVLQKRIADTQSQITSGVRIRSAADAPDQVNALMHVNSDLARMDQVQKNLGTVKTEVDTASGTIQTGIKMLDSIISLGTQATSGTSNTDSRAVVLQQIQSLQGQLVHLTSASAGGRYLFSGDDDANPPYRLNLASANGVDQLTTSSATRLVEGPDGLRFSVSMTAQDLFDQRNADGSAANTNVFAAVNSLRKAVADGVDSEITAALDNLHTAQDHLNVAGSKYGTIQAQVAAALDNSSTSQSHYKIRLSEIRDADLPSSALGLQQAETSLSAAFSAQSQIPRTSLFDYLK